MPNTGAADVNALQAFWCLEGLLVQVVVSQTPTWHHVQSDQRVRLAIRVFPLEMITCGCRYLGSKTLA